MTIVRLAEQFTQDLRYAPRSMAGMMAYRVARRTNGIGIRMALGAERRRLIWMVLREVVLMAVVGLAIGLPAALATTRFVQSFLFQNEAERSGGAHDGGHNIAGSGSSGWIWPGFAGIKDRPVDGIAG